MFAKVVKYFQMNDKMRKNVMFIPSRKLSLTIFEEQKKFESM